MKKSFLLIICLLLAWVVSGQAEEQKSGDKQASSSRQAEASSRSSSAKEKSVHSSEKIPADAAVSFPQDI
ncbi:MAG: hypothetical protein KZQ58_08620 [gamma proteobacterium symbiont of Bathyaustriella thionipta]|nr:hypothetical protein [gamma proteobacterium symbiont of Bathyaustriella thionipta]